jgi:hypothetical protein
MRPTLLAPTEDANAKGQKGHLVHGLKYDLMQDFKRGLQCSRP